jgi:peptidoglycan/LPS O-acetylase OafA/YrhL
LVLSSLLLTGLMFLFYNPNPWYFELPGMPRYIFYGLAFVLLVHGVEAYPIVVNRVTTYLGKISYSCYLLQFAFLELASRYLEPIIDRTSLVNYLWINYGLIYPSIVGVLTFALTLFAVLASTILVGSITYRLIEVPGIALGKMLIKRMERRKLTQRSPLECSLLTQCQCSSS